MKDVETLHEVRYETSQATGLSTSYQSTDASIFRESITLVGVSMAVMTASVFTPPIGLSVIKSLLAPAIVRYQEKIVTNELPYEDFMTSIHNIKINYDELVHELVLGSPVLDDTSLPHVAKERYIIENITITFVEPRTPDLSEALEFLDSLELEDDYL